MTWEGLIVAAAIMAAGIGIAAWLAFAVKLAVDYDYSTIRFVGYAMVASVFLAIFFVVAVTLS